jgi:hypothetical protein
MPLEVKGDLDRRPDDPLLRIVETMFGEVEDGQLEETKRLIIIANVLLLSKIKDDTFCGK